MPVSSSARRPGCTRHARHRSSRSAERPLLVTDVSQRSSMSMRPRLVEDAAVSRRYFGTDGVRGVVGEDLTPDLVERIGKAATLWSGRARVLVGRDTRGSGPELE